MKILSVDTDVASQQTQGGRDSKLSGTLPFLAGTDVLGPNSMAEELEAELTLGCCMCWV